jgi:hypothetical protein
LIDKSIVDLILFIFKTQKQYYSFFNRTVFEYYVQNIVSDISIFLYEWIRDNYYGLQIEIGFSI